MAFCHSVDSIPAVGDVITKVVEDKNCNVMDITFASGKTIAVHLWTDGTTSESEQAPLVEKNP